ncbi:hypothetical protein [Lactobacillus iners]|uniref:hypothetical protein n=1 Tax=Lactobacillus iners TaxID=147802 RepID=UPI0001E9A7E4|nr:hypothetical protein [Lactobacillus iners]EFQ49265.1 hypothetical protein HMPREF9217_0872 [Lactobacillus iners LEAF 2052A-d]
MREIKKILQDEMDYSLCKLLLDYLHFKGMVDDKSWQLSVTHIKDHYDPPTLTLEGIYGKRSSKTDTKNF